jgi:hypothetical protein
MVETKKLKGKQEQHIKTVLESYEQSKNFNLLFNCNLKVDTVVQMMEEKCRIKCEINQCLLGLSTIPLMKLKLKFTTNLDFPVKDCFCSRNDTVAIFSSVGYGTRQIPIYNTSGMDDFSLQSVSEEGYVYGTNQSLIYNTRGMDDFSLRSVSEERHGYGTNQSLIYNTRGMDDFSLQSVSEERYGYGTSQISIYNTSGTNVSSLSSQYMQGGYCLNSQAIADGGPGELAIIIDELNLIEFVDLNGNQQYTMEYNLGDATNMAIKDQLIAIGFHDRIDIVKKQGGGTVVSFVASSPKFLYIDSESRLFYYESNKIVCRSMEGKELFSHTNDCIADIRGMTLDTKGNIYVSSGRRNTVSVLSGDRSSTIDILTEKDGLTQPSFVHFSPNGKHLLVINNNNMQMLLFDII